MQNEFALTKIIATLGPATDSPEVIKQLISEGVDGFRLNFSHGSLKDHKKRIGLVRQVCDEMGTPSAILGDLPGPKIRIGKTPKDGILLEENTIVDFEQGVSEPFSADSNGKVVLSTNYVHFENEVLVGQQILIDDGSVTLECTEKFAENNRITIRCKVLSGGLVSSNKGVNLPDTTLSIPALTEKDHKFIEFAVDQKIDFLALSFVREGKDVVELKDRLRELGARPKRDTTPSYKSKKASRTLHSLKSFIPVVSKIEKPQAIDNLDEILSETDAVMVARGDLGVEMDIAEVAVLQKRIMAKCRDFGIPVIVATQMLQSMIESPQPTRAEVSDVANAIFDGADAIMLSGETAAGKFPVAAVKMMNRIVQKTNAYILSQSYEHAPPGNVPDQDHRTVALAHGVQTVVNDLKASKIVLWTILGGGAVYLSQFKIPRPIIAFSDNDETLRKMALLYAMIPVKMKQPASGSSFIRMVDKYLLKNGLAEKGETIVFVLGEPINRAGVTNRLVIHHVGDAAQ